MAELECVAKKWGSSIGVIIPKEIVKLEKIKPKEIIKISIKKAALAKDVWNLGPIISLESTQKIKDELRKGW